MVRRAAIKSLHALGDNRSESGLLQEFRRPEAAVKRSCSLRVPSVRGVKWQLLIPDTLHGLATARQVAVIAGGLLAVVVVVAGFIMWSPFSGGGDRLVPRGFVESLSFSGDGGTVYAGRGYGRIEVWDVDSEELQETLDFVSGKLVAHDTSGRFLVVGDEAQSGIYDLASRQVVVQESGIKSLSVNMAQTRAASEALDGRVIVWNLESGQIDARLKFDSPDTTAFGVSPDGGLCAVGTSRGAIIVIDMQVSEPKHEFQLPNAGGVSGLAFSADGRTMAVGTTTGQIYLWPLDSEEPATTFTSPDGGRVAQVKFLDTNRLLSLRNQTIDTWDIAAATSTQLAVPLETANALAVDRSGKRAAVGSAEESAIVIIDLEQQQQLAELE
jgi:hypothetical protein